MDDEQAPGGQAAQRGVERLAGHPEALGEQHLRPAEVDPVVPVLELEQQGRDAVGDRVEHALDDGPVLLPHDPHEVPEQGEERVGAGAQHPERDRGGQDEHGRVAQRHGVVGPRARPEHLEVPEGLPRGGDPDVDDVAVRRAGPRDDGAAQEHEHRLAGLARAEHRVPGGVVAHRRGTGQRVESRGGEAVELRAGEERAPDVLAPPTDGHGRRGRRHATSRKGSAVDHSSGPEVLSRR